MHEARAQYSSRPATNAKSRRPKTEQLPSHGAVGSDALATDSKERRPALSSEFGFGIWISGIGFRSRRTLAPRIEGTCLPKPAAAAKRDSHPVPARAPCGSVSPLPSNLTRFIPWLPALVAVAALAALAWWWRSGGDDSVVMRVPGTDAPPGVNLAAVANPAQNGTVTPGPGRPAELPGVWPQFRGPDRDGRLPDPPPLARSWPEGGPPRLWTLPVGEGYAGPAIEGGRIFLLDYDRDERLSVLRCLSLADGAELWRYAYPLTIKRNHGMTRTVPALAGGLVVALDSKCNVFASDADTGELKWAINLVRDFGATVPEWYAGQCPLVIGDQVILAPGGPDTLLLAVKLETGEPLWQTPNPRGWKMTHSSIMPMNFGGHAMYLYCGSGGVAGVGAADGGLLWDTTEWRISIASVPSPVVLPGGRIFLSGGYNAGSLMLELSLEAGAWSPQTAFRLPPERFGATQQTPILHEGHIYGVRPDGQMVCLRPDGTLTWNSGPAHRFGLGAYMLAGGMIFAINDSGRLSLMAATPDRFQLLAETQAIPDGREAWGPLAIAGTRLLVRDFNRLVCLDVGAR